MISFAFAMLISLFDVFLGVPMQLFVVFTL
jgi:hypothetical protein